jgi:hypothetical protein
MRAFLQRPAVCHINRYGTGPTFKPSDTSPVESVANIQKLYFFPLVSSSTGGGWIGDASAANEAADSALMTKSRSQKSISCSKTRVSRVVQKQ